MSGTAYLPWTAPWAAYPQDTSVQATLAALDVCNAASETRDLIDGNTRTVLVLGGGHGGLLALAAARDSLADAGRCVLMDADQHICERALDLKLADVALQVDLRDAVQSLQRLEAAGLPRADLTVVVVNSADCEAGAILLTADHGTVLFFSMATSFSKAALGSEGVASTARMLIPSGHVTDRGAYALELIARDHACNARSRENPYEPTAIPAIANAGRSAGGAPDRQRVDRAARRGPPGGPAVAAAGR